MKAFFLLLVSVAALPLRLQAQTNISFPAESLSSNLVYVISWKPLTQPEREAKEAAIKESAKIKNPDPRLIKVLIDNLSFPPARVRLNPMSDSEYSFHPARDALVKIGRPVVPVLLNCIKTTPDEKRRREQTSLLKAIVGDQSEDLLKKAISDAKNPTHRNRLGECLDELKS